MHVKDGMKEELKCVVVIWGAKIYENCDLLYVSLFFSLWFTNLIEVDLPYVIELKEKSVISSDGQFQTKELSNVTFC